MIDVVLKTASKKLTFLNRNHFFTHSGNLQVTISGLLQLKALNSNQSNRNREKIINLWEYSYDSPTNGIRTAVCQKFLCSLLKIKKGRFAPIQKKIKNNESLENNTGKHSNHSMRLSEDLKKIIDEHCSSIPHSQSHYSLERSQLFYFENSNLILTKLYSLFLEYYAEKTGHLEPVITKSTYSKYFNENEKFSFSTPHTDVCEFCFEHRNTEKDNPELQAHKQCIESYKILKTSMLSEPNVLCLEFDFGQNLALPKIPVSDQFYK